ncbi:diguanylate cyclase domain-containing protein [Wenxinia marina]|uniref:diguanylate cyclase n=1 Tax=Wenxinia marina DSM 24838 TaxID=1123501 RepID=A0A0D0NN90_9RHOB|nr:diguanylate cyclase [Wenxinia marina]KIQ69695.1 diguanylate cyclase (GGDEF) domain protein [Wenxinia marina DSM 24838]GGL60466.1 diguanylate cyclase response regulator [Wenxinia marina]
MSRRILVVDSVCTNRILGAADLSAARFDVRTCDSADAARRALRDGLPDLVAVGVGEGAACHDLLAELRAAPRTRALPIVAVGGDGGTAARLAALQAGADEAFPAGVDPALLVARLRSLLRRRDELEDLRPHDAAARALGFGDEAEPFAAPGRVAVLAGPSGAPPAALAEVIGRLGRRAQLLRDPAELTRQKADVVLLDAAGGAAGPDAAGRLAASGGCLSPGALFRAIAEVRAQGGRRQAEILAIVPPGATDLAVMALDLGAGDLVTADVGTAELSWRIDGLLRRKRVHDRLRDKVRDGLQAAVTDPLTGIANRRFAMATLGGMARAAGPGAPLAVMVLDIDHFKAVNDRHGHVAGDCVLIEVAGRMAAALRPGDLFARIGGEEFLVAAPGLGAAAARDLADRLRAAVADREVEVSNEMCANPAASVSVTISAGLAIGQGDEGDRLFGRADAALYAAKRDGRDRICLWSDPTATAPRHPVRVAVAAQPPGGPRRDWLSSRSA